MSIPAGVIPPSKVTTSHVVCPQCAVKKKSGKLSCCSSGGAWFNKCADEVDSNFDHTWNEGVQACKHVASSQIKLKYDAIITQNLNATQEQIMSNQQTTNSHLRAFEDSASDADTSNSKSLGGITTFTTLFLIMMHPFLTSV